jgi:hypothetical protein
MGRDDMKKLSYIVACVAEFSRAVGLDAQEAFRYLNYHGGKQGA